MKVDSFAGTCNRAKRSEAQVLIQVAMLRQTTDCACVVIADTASSGV